MYKRLPFYLILSLAVCCIVSALQPETSAQAPTSGKSTAAGHLRKPSKYSGAPVVAEFVNKETEPPQAQVHRQIREERYGDHLLKPLVDPGFTVDGQTETSNLTFIDYVKPNDPDASTPGIPASASSAIVIGTVLSGKCFVNNPRTFVYTDYQVKIDQILKPDPTTNLAAGDVITASRPGGAVHFPSGHLTNVLNVGHGLPKIDAQYVLFLWKANPNFPEYEIVIDSGYELKNGRVYSLDDANSQYDGLDSNTLLAKIHAAIASSQGGKQ